MKLTLSLLQLHLSQAESALKGVMNNSYSDQRKEDYQNKLFDLFKGIKESIKTSPPATVLEVFVSYKRHLDFIFKSLEFLNSSTLNQIPYEIVESLDVALQDWAQPEDEFIIVTSLINNVGGFSFDSSLVFSDAIYTDIENEYGLKFEYKLVQINVPKALSRDYLAAVVLYHELAHFIDTRNSICDSITRMIALRIEMGSFNKLEKVEFIKYFPYIKTALETSEKIIPNTTIWFYLKNHLTEYYCDLFASQYIGEAINHYLYYITENESKFSSTHPSTINRNKIVADFINNGENTVVKIISEGVLSITGEKIETRYDILDNSDYTNLVPIQLNSERELHGIYNALWGAWLERKDEIQKLISNSDESSLKVYSILNNLTEKSIGNYITLGKWKKQVK